MIDARVAIGSLTDLMFKNRDCSLVFSQFSSKFAIFLRNRKADLDDDEDTKYLEILLEVLTAVKMFMKHMNNSLDVDDITRAILQIIPECSQICERRLQTVVAGSANLIDETKLEPPTLYLIKIMECSFYIVTTLFMNENIPVNDALLGSAYQFGLKNLEFKSSRILNQIFTALLASFYRPEFEAQLKGRSEQFVTYFSDKFQYFDFKLQETCISFLVLVFFEEIQTKFSVKELHQKFVTSFEIFLKHLTENKKLYSEKTQYFVDKMEGLH